MKVFTKTNKWVVTIALVAFLILSAGQDLHAQDSELSRYIFPSGIHAGFGFGFYSVKDQYISKEKYSGALPMIYLGWARGHNNYFYKLNFEYRNADDIKNNNVQTNITQFTLGQGFLYPIQKKTLNPQKLFLYLGPNTEIFYYENKPKIAVSGFDYARSNALMFSVGISLEAIYSLSHKFQIESSLDMTVISLGVRSVDSEEDDQLQTKLLTMFSGLNSNFDLGIRYKFYRCFSTVVGYKFQLTSINAWDPLISASNNFFIGLTYKF